MMLYEGNPYPPDNGENFAWLDKIIAEQAAYYGLSVDRFTRAMHNAAELQERAESEGWDA